MSTAQMNPQVWAFGGAKGGVGRSVICAASALALVEQGKKVITLDFDLGSANLHTLMGIIQPKSNLEQWILGEVSHLQDVCSPTQTPNLYLISGAASIFNPSHPSSKQLQRLLNEALSLEADYILIDLGAGIHPHTLDFFNVSGRSFMITTPEPTSIQNTYAFYKATLIRRLEVVLDSHPWLKKILQRASLAKGSARINSLGRLLDMLKELDIQVNREVTLQLESLSAPLIINRAYPDDEPQVLEALKRICGQFLQVDLEHAVTIPEDRGLRHAIRQLHPIHELPSDSKFLTAVREWVKRDLEEVAYTPIQETFLPLIGKPSFLSMSSPEEPSQFKIEPPMTEENQLVNAIRTLNTSTSQRAALQSQTGSRDWKEVAWPDSTNEQSVIPSSAEYDIYGGEEPSSVESPLYDDEIEEEHYFEPKPIDDVEMTDPPQHEVIALEEELRTDRGWFHLKTVDLAPFRPSIRTSVYQGGARLLSQEESYLALYEQGIYGTEVAKRVERIHHQSRQKLQNTGVEGWSTAPT